MITLVAVTLAMLSSSNSAPPPTVSNLQCEYLTSPNVVETPAPRLSWITNYSGRNWNQMAYRIQVASSLAALQKSKPDLWDSGTVTSDSSIQIEYGGEPLASGQKCFWKVRVWDKDGNPSAWSKPAEWEMGLLKESDWKNSQWIGRNADSPSPEPAPYLRKEFNANGKISKAKLYVCGLGYAELHLNGKKLGNTERDPGYTNFDKRVLYIAHDVTSAIKQGPNALGAILGTGWYDTHDRATWNFHKAPWRSRPRMRLLLNIEYADGRTESVVSDNSWKLS